LRTDLSEFELHPFESEFDNKFAHLNIQTNYFKSSHFGKCLEFEAV